MQRRRVLRGLAAVAAGAAAGCTGANREVPVTAPEPPDEVRNAGSGGSSNGGETPESLQFAVPEWSYEATEDGDLRVVLTVENRAQSPDEATMTVVLTAGDKRFTPTEHVSLQPASRGRYGSSSPLRTANTTRNPGSKYGSTPARPRRRSPRGRSRRTPKTGRPRRPRRRGQRTPQPSRRLRATATRPRRSNERKGVAPEITAAGARPVLRPSPR
ncbi:hypothetical protein ACFQL4_14490 [Halosimplex aquaticum]